MPSCWGRAGKNAPPPPRVRRGGGGRTEGGGGERRGRGGRGGSGGQTPRHCQHRRNSAQHKRISGLFIWNNPAGGKKSRTDGKVSGLPRAKLSFFQLSPQEAALGLGAAAFERFPKCRGSFLAAAQLEQQVSAQGEQQIIGPQLERLDRRERFGRSVDLGHRYRAVQRDHRGGVHRQKLVVQHQDARPIELAGDGGFGVRGGNRGLGVIFGHAVAGDRAIEIDRKSV